MHCANLLNNDSFLDFPCWPSGWDSTSTTHVGDMGLIPWCRKIQCGQTPLVRRVRTSKESVLMWTIHLRNHTLHSRTPCPHFNTQTSSPHSGGILTRRENQTWCCYPWIWIMKTPGPGWNESFALCTLPDICLNFQECFVSSWTKHLVPLTERSIGCLHHLPTPSPMAPSWARSKLQ